MSKQTNKPNASRIQLDLGLILLSTGALANITLWIGAFAATEDDGPIGAWVRQVLLPVLGGISGLSMGITVTVGLVYVLGRLSHMAPTLQQKKRGTKKTYRTVPNLKFYTAWLSIILLLIISPALLGPYVFMVISGKESIYVVLGDWWARAWSVARIIAADLALAAVAMVYGVQLHALGSVGRAPKSSKSATQSETSATTTPIQTSTTASTPSSASELRPCDVPGCGIPYKWPQGKGGHYKKFHPDLVIQKGIPAKVSLPINAESHSQKGGN